MYTYTRDYQLKHFVSGLVDYVPIDQMENRLVVVLCNLKPAKLKGIESKGMVLCASVTNDDDTKSVEPLVAPEGAIPGDIVYVEGYEAEVRESLHHCTLPYILSSIYHCECIASGIIILYPYIAATWRAIKSQKESVGKACCGP